ncbi:hypothetical protein EV426DRAFT_572650 [Tirmania nivea]|nr:hypothetical protein EV426DRAFT_572650 [Tirmania nivea]
MAYMKNIDIKGKAELEVAVGKINKLLKESALTESRKAWTVIVKVGIARGRNVLVKKLKEENKVLKGGKRMPRIWGEAKVTRFTFNVADTAENRVGGKQDGSSTGSSTKDKPNTDTRAKLNINTRDKPNMNTRDKPNTDTRDKPNTDTREKLNTNSKEKPNMDIRNKPNTDTRDKPNIDTKAKYNKD